MLKICKNTNKTSFSEHWPSRKNTQKLSNVNQAVISGPYSFSKVNQMYKNSELKYVVRNLRQLLFTNKILTLKSVKKIYTITNHY